MTTVTATRTIPADPASTALLLAGPSALEFWPGITRVDGLVSPVSAEAVLAGSSNRRLVVRADPPQRTPTAYVTAFRVEADGLPSASGCLRVTRQGWVGDPSGEVDDGLLGRPSASVQFQLSTDEDYDDGVEREIAAAVNTFLDNMAAFVGGRVTAA